MTRLDESQKFHFPVNISRSKFNITYTKKKKKKKISTETFQNKIF